MKYMVLECHLSYAVVLDEDGRFLKVANKRYEVGQTVTDVVEMHPPQVQETSGRKQNKKWIYSLAAMAACLVLIVTSVFQTGQTPYASVYMTINPEVRIDVNRKDVVVGVEGVNADGANLIHDYSYKKKALDLVMDELVDRAIDMGYLHEGGQITLTLDADDDAWIVSRSDALTTHLNEHLTEKLSVTIEVTNLEPQTQQVVIPITPDAAQPDDGYSESDYGTQTPSDEQTATPPDSGKPAVPSTDDGQTDYGDAADDTGNSNYSDSAETDYRPDDTTPDTDDGQSNYDDPVDAPEDPVENDDQSDDSDDGQSGYQQTDDGASNYEASDDGASGYGESDDD